MNPADGNYHGFSPTTIAPKSSDYGIRLIPGFMVYQFRSMCKDAEEAKSSLLRLNRKSIALNIRTTTARCIGRLLPKFQIDHWPQLWKVLRGDVSLVGPRPAVLDEVE